MEQQIMSDHIYSQFFSESISKPTLTCQYVSCGAPLSGNRKFCNLTCCNTQNALRQSQDAEKRRATKQAAYELNPRKCLVCEEPINWESYIISKAKYCSNSCASTHNNKVRSQSSRNKQRQSILKTFHNGELPDKSFKELYYSLASFKFDVYDYPHLMDIKLLSRHGWYSCGGRSQSAKNLNGVTRDHILSVSNGLDQRIHPLLLSHPTNCKLVLSTDNSRKSSRSNITAEQLITSIKSFDLLFKHQTACLKIIQEDRVLINDHVEFMRYYGID